MNKSYKAHPLMIAKMIKPFLFVLVIPFLKGIIQYLLYRRISGVLTFELTALAIISLVGVFKLRCFQLTLTEEKICIEQGFLFKNKAEIPIEKISSVVTLQNPIDTVLRAVTFRVNTEAGLVGRPDYEFKLYKKDAAVVAGILYGDEKRAAVKFSVRRLAVAAALSSSAVTGLIVAVPVIYRAGELLDIALSEALFSELNKTAQSVNTYFPPVFNIITLILLIGYAVSFVYTLIGTLRFRLFSDAHHIELRYGVFVRRHILFKKERVNDICIDQTPLMRLTRLFRMRAAVGGFGGEKAEKALLVPVGRRFELKNNLSMGFNYFKTDGRVLRAARGRRTLWRFLCIPAMLSVLTVAVGSVCSVLFPYFDRFIVFLMLVSLIAVAYYAGLRYYGYKFGQLRLGNNICARGSNGVNTRELYCPKERVGLIKIRQNPVDRRKNTCKVSISIRSESSDNVKVRHLNVDAVSDNIKECFDIE